MTNILFIRDVQLGMKTWTCKVTVQEKQQINPSLSTPTKKQKLIFIDSEGTEVEGIIFNTDIPTMSPRIQVYKKYLISNADVREIPERYRTSGITIQWVITTRTIVEEVSDDDTIIPVKFNYTSFKDLALFVDQKDKPVDVLAVVVHALEKTPVNKNNRTRMVQKFVLVNDSLQPIILSMWVDFVANEGQQIVDNLASYPVVICRRLIVGYFNGVNLSTWFDSVILLDPPVQEARELKNWAMRNTSSLSDIVEQKTYNNYNPEISLQSPQKTVLVANVLPTQKSIWGKGQISFEHICQRYWYMGCKNCYRSTSASHGVSFLCNSCNAKHPAEPRSRFDIDITDESGTITASLFGELAEKLLTFTAAESMDYFNKNIELPLQLVHQGLKSKMFLVHIKPVRTQMADGKQRYTVLYYSELPAEEDQQLLGTKDATASNSPGSHLHTDHFDIPGTEASSSKVRICLADKFDDSGTTATTPPTSPSENTPKRGRLT